MELDDETYNKVVMFYAEHTFHSIGQKKAIKFLKNKGFERHQALRITQEIFAQHFQERYTGLQLLVIACSYVGITLVLSEIVPIEYKEISIQIMAALGFICYGILIRLKL